jgi:hypothetical protein
MEETAETPKFEEGDPIRKSGAGYSGPGMVMAAFMGIDGHWRYVVGHRIENGLGVFYHIYGEAQLQKRIGE